MSRSKAIICMLLAATACGPGTEEDPVIVQSGVQAELVPTGVLVTNGSMSTIRLHVLNSYWLGQLAPCNAPQSGCTTLDPGAKIVVPNRQING